MPAHSTASAARSCGRFRPRHRPRHRARFGRPLGPGPGGHAVARVGVRLLTGTLALTQALTLTLAAPVSAQTPARGPILFELPLSARTLGLGGTPQIGATDPGHLFSSPAMVGGGGFRISALPTGGTASAISMVTGFSAFGGGIGVGVRTLEYEDGPAGSSSGGVDPIVSPGTVGHSTQAATLGYSRDFFGFDFGVAGTLFADRSDGDRATSYSVDLGVARQLGDFDLSFTARNLGEEVALAGADIRSPTNLELVVGAYGQRLGPLDLGFAGRLGRRDDDEFVYGGGLEIGYYPIQGRTFVARVGGQNVPEGDGSPISMGGSYWGDSIVLEYAFRPVDGLDDLHLFTVGWR